MLRKKIVISPVEKIAELLQSRNETVATAESCTGGLISASFTALAGSSNWFTGGMVTYSNEAKQKLLSVSPEIFDLHGAVSEECAREMAKGARSSLETDWAISVTGIAGPGGGSIQKPVGLVYIGLAGPLGVTVTKNIFPGGRDSVRKATVEKAVSLLLDSINS